MALFYYEKSPVGRWQPVVYTNKPGTSINGSDPDRIGGHEVPPEMMGSDGVSPQFSELQRLYPAPPPSIGLDLELDA